MSGKSLILFELANKCWILVSLWMLAKFFKPFSSILRHFNESVPANEFLWLSLDKSFISHKITGLSA